MSIDAACREAAQQIADADGLLITAGAGMGVDSGLPDFRGDQGFWNAYPVLGKSGIRFSDIANPKSFTTRPTIGWGFYGHRLKLYRDTQPHAGFAQLTAIGKHMPNGAFVFTSNVDGHFQKSGFALDRVIECHGSIHYFQCLDECGQPVWSANDFQPIVDTSSCTLLSDLPTCPECGKLARPNILMFNDWAWDSFRTDRQHSRFNAWLARSQRPVIIEIGAGTSIPTVRRFGEEVGCPMIRINPDDSAIGLRRGIGVRLGALEGISRIAHALGGL